MKPKISIIMSIYNNQDTLEEAVDSILNQTYSDFELLITDDKSTDNSLKILKKYAKRDNRVFLFKNNRNIGLTKSLNNMIDKCNGMYIARMDGDDISLPSRLEKQLDVLLKDKSIDILFSDTTLIDETNNIICPSWRPSNLKKILKWLPYNNYIPHPTVVIKTEVLKKYKYNEAYRTGQDKELWLRLRKSKQIFYYLKKPLLLYRINPNSVRGKVSDLDYNLARYCINNKQKLKALRYIKKVGLRKKTLIIIKMFIPYRLLVYRGLMIRKYRSRRGKNDKKSPNNLS